MSSMNRRHFLKAALTTAAATSVPGRIFAEDKKPLFGYSVAEWSFHRMIRSGKLDNLDFPLFVKKEFGITAVEYVNQFFKDKAKDEAYLTELKKRCTDNGIYSHLIMVDGEGQIGAPKEEDRLKTIENHKKWVDAAKFLGCATVRVNAGSAGSYEEQMERAADGLSRLSEYAATMDLNIVVENHGGLSSNGAWLAGVMKKVNRKNCGTLPDFGNFHDYDRYKGTDETMPFAKAVSAKSHDFNEAGDETKTDYFKIMDIVMKHGYRGLVGIEYEGGGLGEVEGVRATQKLLERVAVKLAETYS